MITLQQIQKQLELKIISQPEANHNLTVSSAYASDLLSCVMAGAKPGCIWVTLQSHLNVIAVATLLDMGAIIMTENAQPEPAVIEKAIEQGVTIFSTPESSFTICGKLWEMGLRAG